MLGEMADTESWSKRVEEWRASGLTAKEFSGRHGVSLSGLRNWSYRLRAAERAEEEVSEARPVKLVPVTVKPKAEAAPPSPSEAESPKPALILEVGGARLSVPTGFDRGTLRAVLDVLGERPVRGGR
jgi:transposase